jgi:hypothetical protein
LASAYARGHAKLAWRVLKNERDNIFISIKVGCSGGSEPTFGWLQVDLDSIIQKFVEIFQSWFALLEDKLVAGEISHSGFWHYLQASFTVVIKSEL